MPRYVTRLFSSPLLRRVGWHFSRVRGAVDRRFFAQLLGGAFGLVLIAAAAITFVEKPLTLSALGASVNWGIQTILGQGDSSYVTSPIGWIVGWFFSLFGVAIVGTLTGALVALVIDFLLKEGQGLGASGYHDHIVVCGWNQTARDLIDELKGDEYRARVVVIAEADKNPAGDGVYFVHGDSTDTAALERAGIRDAKAALIFPATATNDADMHSILTIMAIESMAPLVRTVAEVNNPRHVEHFRRARADEVLVTSRLASRLLARSALYPGLSQLVTDMVSGGDGSELYRVTLPEQYLGMTVDDVSRALRADHRATLLAIKRGEQTFTNPPRDFVLQPEDDALVLAESLGALAPLTMHKRALAFVSEAEGEPDPASARETAGA